LTSVASTTLVIAGFLVLAGLVQPAAERLHLPYTVLLAVVGVAIGGFSSFLLFRRAAGDIDLVRGAGRRSGFEGSLA
jgi:asparagine N-glycosylation enzyme membrane subunit Stt3